MLLVACFTHPLSYGLSTPLTNCSKHQDTVLCNVPHHWPIVPVHWPCSLSRVTCLLELQCIVLLLVACATYLLSSACHAPLACCHLHCPAPLMLFCGLSLQSYCIHSLFDVPCHLSLVFHCQVSQDSGVEQQMRHQTVSKWRRTVTVGTRQFMGQ